MAQNSVDEFVGKEYWTARLQKAMKLRGVSQRVLAKKTDMSPATYENYVAKRTTPSLARVERIASALDVNPAWLCGFDAPMELRGFATNDFLAENEKLPEEEKPSGLNEDFEESANEREKFE